MAAIWGKLCCLPFKLCGQACNATCRICGSGCDACGRCCHESCNCVENVCCPTNRLVIETSFVTNGWHGFGHRASYGSA
eukprot:5478706-Pyramimonas_sp.AAC.1